METVDCHSNDSFDQLRAHAKQRLPFATQPNHINQRFFSFIQRTIFVMLQKRPLLVALLSLTRSFEASCSSSVFVHKICSFTKSCRHKQTYTTSIGGQRGEKFSHQTNNLFTTVPSSNWLAAVGGRKND